MAFQVPPLHYNPDMSEGLPGPVTDPNWPEILSLSSHEVRSPVSVLAGYIRMLLQQRAGPLSDEQRRLLEAAERACGRLTTVLAELSELARLESKAAPFNRSTVDLPTVVREAIAKSPGPHDRQIAITLSGIASVSVHGDATRLRTSFGSLFDALRREVVNSEALGVRVESDGSIVRVTIAEPGRLDQLSKLAASALVTFDEWKRGGTGLSLPNARRVIEAHGGRLLSPADYGKACAIVLLPVR